MSFTTCCTAVKYVEIAMLPRPHLGMAEVFIDLCPVPTIPKQVCSWTKMKNHLPPQPSLVLRSREHGAQVPEQIALTYVLTFVANGC